MSTVPKRPQHVQFGQTQRPLHSAAPETTATPPPPRRRRRRLAIPAILLVLAVVVWFLPAIVAHSFLFQWILGAATADLQGTVQVDSASLGWFSPIVLRNLEIRDQKNQPLAQTAEFSTEKSLLGFLGDHSTLGKLRLEQLQLTLVSRPDGSNIEDALAKYLAPSSGPPWQGSLAVEIAGASISILDQSSRHTARLENCTMLLDMSKGINGPLHLKASSEIADQTPGHLLVEVNIGQPDAQKQSDATGATDKASIEVADLPLALLESLLSRLGANVRVDGWLSSHIVVQWSGEGTAAKTTIRGDLSADEVSLTGAALGPDQVLLHHANASYQIVQQSDSIRIEQSLLECDLGAAALSGTLQLGKDMDLSHNLFDTASRQTIQAKASLNLARLAAMLPNTLSIRKDTRITSGEVSLTLSAQPDGILAGATLPATKGKGYASDMDVPAAEGSARMIWKGRVEASGLRAVAQGRQLAWERPILLVVNAHDGPQGPVVEDLQCDSDFLKVQASGTPDNLDATATFNLKQLADQLGQFIDLGGLKMAGDGQGRFTCKRPQAERYALAGDLQLRNIQLVGGGLQIDVQQASLALPDADYGNLKLAFRQGKLTASQLHFASPWLNLTEPVVEATVAGSWDHSQQKLQLETTTLATSAMAMRGDNLVIAFPSQKPVELAGALAFRGELARVQQWFATSNVPPGLRFAGQFEGSAALDPSAGRIAGQLNAAATNLVVSNSSGEQFQQPQVNITCQGSYDPKTGLVQVAQLQLQSAVLGGNLSGQLATASSSSSTRAAPAAESAAANLELSGQVAYDLEKVMVLLRPYVGTDVRIAGRNSSAAAYRGPLDLAAAEANAAVKWDSANVYGFPIGAGEMKARLSNGLLGLDNPLELSVSRGSIILSPTVRLAAEPKELTLPVGPLVRQVQITPEMCKYAMKYIAPILADVTEARGAFSVNLQNCRIPLNDPAIGDIAGQLVIHSVEIGPGPLIRAFAILLGREAPATLRRESVVPFRLSGGRVYHEQLELIFPELIIRTKGSVGLDQSLELEAEMPVPPKWLANTPVGSALRNQTIRLPIHGTLSKPQIDVQVMEQLSKQFIQNAAKNVIEDQLNRQLDRLFTPPK
jgi:translocation and assembly module TamB